MKLTTSFTDPVTRTEPVLIAGAWGIAFASLFTMFLLINQANTMVQERPELLKRLEHLKQRKNEINIVESRPEHKSIVALKEKVSSINNLLGGRGWSTNRILVLLEGILPKDVLIKAISHKRLDGEIQIVADASKVESLTVFLVALERQQHFSEVLLKKQSRYKTGGVSFFRFDIQISERAK